MNEGWICPKCGRVYNPLVPSCGNCNNKITKTNEKREKIRGK